VGLGAEHELFLKVYWALGFVPTRLSHATLSQKIVPPVLHSFLDQDSRVRYYACEALYNIAKASMLVAEC
jgi:hypothetical protein